MSPEKLIPSLSRQDSISEFLHPKFDFPLTGEHLTTIFVTNLHCNSCVHTIEEAVFSLCPIPSSVNVSLESQSVIVQHSGFLNPREIELAINEAGFDVSKRDETDILDLTLRASAIVARRLKHIQNCFKCGQDHVFRAGQYKGLTSPTPNAESSLVGLLRLPSGDSRQGWFQTGPPTPKADVSRPRPFTPLPPSNISRRKNLTIDNRTSAINLKDPTGPLRVVFSIGGMTCAACSNTITRAMSELSGVSKAAISLLDHSGTAVVERQEMIKDIVEKVEDCGFEISLFSVDPVQASEATEDDVKRRVVSLRVDGMFCQHCPDKIAEVLQSMGHGLTVLKPISKYDDPIMIISYEPSTPSFTIRTIISTITSAKSPPYSVSIYEPASLEDLSRTMQLKEQQSLRRRLIFAIIAAVPTFVIAIIFMNLVKNGNPSKEYLLQPMWTGNVSRTEWALFFLATPVFFYSAGPFHRKSLKEIYSLWRRGSKTPVIKRFTHFGSMSLLVSSGVSVAYISSIALLGLAATQPASSTGMGDNSTYFDSVVLLTMFLLAGRYLEAYSKSRTADAVKALGSLRPQECLLMHPRSTSEIQKTTPNVSGRDVENGDPSLSTKPGWVIDKINAGLLELGDIVRVPSGSSPPTDGIIVSGFDCSFDESSLSGESRLIKKQIGDQVFLGTISKNTVDVMVNALGGGTMLDNIIKVVREGQTQRAPIERVADLLTGYFVPVITLLAVVTWLVWLALGLSGVLPPDYLDISIGGWALWSLEFAIAVFVVACPCGIGLAAPTALLVGSGKAASFGILARGGGEAFQEMAQLDIAVFDKTGTLTEGGDPQVSDAMIFASGKWSRETLLGIAMEIESSSSHPLATAIRNFCRVGGATAHKGDGFEEVAGMGIRATFDAEGCDAIIGNERYMNENNALITPEVRAKLGLWTAEAKSVALLAIQDKKGDMPFYVCGIFAVTDVLRPEAKAVISALQGQGIQTWMISGDNLVTAQAVARTVGIPETQVIAGVLPHQKAEKIRWLQQEGGKKSVQGWWQRKFQGKHTLNKRCVVSMIGDGINDSPALMAADIGIAIGSGSDVAISSASFVLLSSNLRSLLTLSDLSRTVFRRVKFNFMWAVMYNLIALPIAAGVAYPAGRVRLSPVWASLAMALSSLTVVCSSLFLKLYKEPKI